MDAKAYNNRGNAYRNKGDYDRAIASRLPIVALHGAQSLPVV